MIDSNLILNTFYNESNYKGIKGRGSRIKGIKGSKGWKSETFLRVLEQSTLGCVERLGYHKARYHQTISIDALRFDRSAKFGRIESAPQQLKTHSRITAEYKGRSSQEMWI